MDKIEVVYVTSNAHKRAENAAFLEQAVLSDGRRVADVFDFTFESVDVKETLEVELAKMVSQEVRDAYARVLVPCIVEHAGLVFEGHAEYPGGITKAMWKVLGTRFVEDTNSEGRLVTARAVVAYCDGKSVHTFIGETKGVLRKPVTETSDAFYWDVAFVPDGEHQSRTYAEIVSEEGLTIKMAEYSQSSKAMLSFLEYRAKNAPELWRR